MTGVVVTLVGSYGTYLSIQLVPATYGLSALLAPPMLLVTYTGGGLIEQGKRWELDGVNNIFGTDFQTDAEKYGIGPGSAYPERVFSDWPSH